jgi:hypothetical protein
MGYGVNQWASQPGRARAAGSSRGKSTRTAKRKSKSSARRAPKKSATKKRRSLQSQDQEQRGLTKPPKGWAGTKAEYIRFLSGGPGKWY